MNLAKRLLLPGIALCLLGFFAPDFPYKVETEHYEIQSKVEEEKIEDFAKYMELVVGTYEKLLQVESPKGKKFPLTIYSNMKDYQTEGRGPKGSAAYYSPTSKKLVGFYDKDKMTMYNIYAHEGMHQFTDIAVPNFIELSKEASWYTEGIADCIGNSKVKNGKLYMCTLDGTIALWRTKTLEQSKKKGKLYALKDLLKLTKKDYYNDAPNCYAHGWALCHFLLTAPKLEDPYRQIPDGKYKKFLAYFHEALSKGWTMEKAYEYAFEHGQNDQKMPDIEALDKEWKLYIDKLIAEFQKRDAKKKQEADKKKAEEEKKNGAAGK